MSKKTWWNLGVLLFATSSAIGQPLIPKDPTKPFILPNFNFSIEQEGKKQIPIEQTTYILQSIIIGNGRNIALINDTFVRPGDVIDGAKVIRIEKNSVWLSNQGRKIKLYLFEPGIRN